LVLGGATKNLWFCNLFFLKAGYLRPGGLRLWLLVMSASRACGPVGRPARARRELPRRAPPARRPPRLHRKWLAMNLFPVYGWRYAEGLDQIEACSPG
jgi:hypothetical protein